MSDKLDIAKLEELEKLLPSAELERRLQHFFNARFDNYETRFREALPYGEQGGEYYLVGVLSEAIPRVRAIPALLARIRRLEAALEPNPSITIILRSIANSEYAKQPNLRHDIILNAAADIIENARAALEGEEEG